jgi:SAM-dependent methyltransferase
MSDAIVAASRYAASSPSQAATRHEPRWQRFIDLLRCPATGAALTLSPDRSVLTTGAAQYPLKNGIPLVLRGDQLAAAQAWHPGAKVRLRDRIQSLRPSAVSGRRQKRYLRQFLARQAAQEAILNIGSGGWSLGTNVLNVDLLPFAGVDLCGDIHALPFAAGSIDALVCTGVLEHVPDAPGAVASMHRILRPGGEIFCTIPFLQPYHEDPDDYRRFTNSGLKELFAAFTTVRIWPSHGPGSTLAWVIGDALAAVLCGNSGRLHTAWTMLLRYLCYPLRALDRITEGSPFEHRVCSALLVEAVK